MGRRHAHHGIHPTRAARGRPVTERTEVRILVDGEAIYIGAWLYDRDAGGVVPGERVRDGDITKSDYFGVMFDTYHDRQNGFVFTTTRRGSSTTVRS